MVKHKKYKSTRSVDDAFASSTNQLRYIFGDLDFFGIKPFQIYDKVHYMNDYMKNRNLSWSDMKYPTLTSYAGSGSGAWHGSVESIERLYNAGKPDPKAYKKSDYTHFMYG